jgi:hypothetical protein
MRQRRVAIALVAIAIDASQSLPAQQQDSAAHVQSVRGATRAYLDLDVNIEPIRGASINAVLAPFVTERLQLGIAPYGYASSFNGQTYYLEQAAAIANYFFLVSGNSRPFAGAYLAQAGQSYGPGYGTYGAQLGWLYFLAPSVGFRAEFRYRSDFRAHTPASTYVIVSLDPYLFGPASGKIGALPHLGVVDVSLLANYVYTPDREVSAQAMLAPFLTRWLQVGGTLDYFFLFGFPEAHKLEWLARTYAPLARRAMPFAEGFAEYGNFSDDVSGLSSFGLRGGVRSYVAPAVALDAALEWRKHGEFSTGVLRHRSAEEVSLRVSLLTEFRLARRR